MMSTCRKPLFPLWVALVSMLMTGGLPAQNENGSELPERPESRVFDEAQWFSQMERERLAREIDGFCQENEMDVFLITRPTHPPQGATAFVRAVGKAWSQAPVWCVVFYVPGDPAGFHVQGGGVNMNSERVQKALAEASKRANREATAKARVMAAWRECAEVLRFVLVSGKRRSEPIVQQQQRTGENRITREKWKKIFLVSAVGGTLIVVLAVVLGVGMVRKNRLPSVFEFPETTWRVRYQAPYSGGGGIVVSYRVPK